MGDFKHLRAKLGAHSNHAQHDSREFTANGRAEFLGSFEQQVDPEGTLPEDERKRRADHALKAHMTRLALASVRSRAKARVQKDEEVDDVG